MSPEHREVAPDWEHWLNMSEVRARDFVLLSLNVEPRLFPVKSSAVRIDYRLRPQMEEATLRAESFKPRLEQLISAVESKSSKSLFGNAIYRLPPGDKSLVTVELASCLRWAASLPRPWTLPGDLSALIANPAGESGAALKESPRELLSYQKILIALVMKHYEYDPNKERSNVTAKIKARLSAVGLHLDDDTIRKCLRNSARHIKIDIQDNKRPK